MSRPTLSELPPKGQPINMAKEKEDKAPAKPRNVTASFATKEDYLAYLKKYEASDPERFARQKDDLLKAVAEFD